MAETKRGGRVAGVRNKRTIAMLELAEKGETPVAFGLRLMRDENQTPEVRMNGAKLAAPYVHPRPQPEPRLVEFELPEDIKTPESLLSVHANIMQATATGSLALEDAKDLSAMLETHRRLVETVDLEARLARLEATQSK